MYRHPRTRQPGSNSMYRHHRKTNTLHLEQTRARDHVPASQVVQCDPPNATLRLGQALESHPRFPLLRPQKEIAV
eukprot:2783677-Rhodomonas_salina.1